MDPTAPTEITQVIEVVETIDYTELLSQINGNLFQLLDAANLITGFALFFVVVVLCYFSYKFFRLFF